MKGKYTPKLVSLSLHVNLICSFCEEKKSIVVKSPIKTAYICNDCIISVKRVMHEGK